MSTSFSPNFEDFTAYGDKEVPPQHHEPYAKRADPQGQPNAKSLSPAMNSWIISPQTSMKNVLQAKKDEERRHKSVLEAALPIAKKMKRSFQLKVTKKENEPTRTQIQVSQEDHSNDDEEEKLPPTPVAAFEVQENTGDDKFPWAIVNAETGLEVAFYKYKTTDFASHLEDGEKLRKERLLELELYGKTPLFEAQKYRKKTEGNPEIIYHWASVKKRAAVRTLFGLISIAESIEMNTKHETPQELTLIRQKTGGFTIFLRKKEVAIGEIMKDGKLRLTIQPKIDPTLIIIFLSVTGCLTPSST